MLESLEISQFALIEAVSLELAPGFNCITGETGAGKSLLLGAIGAITGEQISKTLIRQGSEKAKIDAVFTNVKDIFAENIEIESLIDSEDLLILSRELRVSGRNTCRVNGQLVPLSFLRNAGVSLADIHGQNDRQQIFEKAKHLAILDRFGHSDIDEKFAEYLKAYRALLEIKKLERNLLADPEERRMALERLDYQINEIQTVSPVLGEDEELRLKKNLLQNKEKIRQTLAQSISLFESNGHLREAFGTLDNLDQIAANLEELSSFDASFEKYLFSFNEALETLSDINLALKDELLSINSDGASLEEISSRLDRITRLKRKYNGSIEEVWKYFEEANKKRDDLLASSENVSKIKEKKEKVIAILEERGLALRQTRKAWAEKMEQGIEAELEDLGMKNARFKVKFNEFDVSEAGANGLEDCEFLLSANIGEEFKPLAKTASGGEASRIMLAIKVVLAQADNLQLLVFDEIDTGISGETTNIVAEKLKLLSRSHQVICVTHQAQIAAVADKHFFIYKETDSKRTRTNIREMSEAERLGEIARLLSGKSNDANSLELAAQLLEKR